MSKWYPCIYCTEDLHCTKYSDDDSESWCVLGPCTAETPSNGDKIRRMTDEELAEWVAERSTAPNCTGKCHKDYEVYGELRTFCHDCWAKWLKQEAT